MINSWWFLVKHLLMLFKVASLALGQSYVRASVAALKNMDIFTINFVILQSQENETMLIFHGMNLIAVA